MITKKCETPAIQQVIPWQQRRDVGSSGSGVLNYNTCTNKGIKMLNLVKVKLAYMSRYFGVKYIGEGEWQDVVGHEYLSIGPTCCRQNLPSHARGCAANLGLLHLFHHFGSHPAWCTHERFSDVTAVTVPYQPSRHAKIGELYAAILAQQYVSRLYVSMDLTRSIKTRFKILSQHAANTR